MKLVSAVSSRGCSTTAPDTADVGETGPSCLAPRGMSGLGATMRVPVGAAAPAPAAEIAKHTSASSGIATSARRATRLLIKLLLVARLLPPRRARPSIDTSYRKSETQYEVRR